MQSRELGRIGYFSGLSFSVCLLVSGCGGGNALEPDSTGGTTGVPGGAGGSGGAAGSTSAKGGDGGSLSSGGNVGATGGITSGETGGTPGTGGSPTAGSPGTGGSVPGAGGGGTSTGRGGSGVGGSATGGATGGTGGTGGAGGTAAGGGASGRGGASGTGGTGPVGGSGGTTTQGKVWSKCRFHFGTQTSKLTSALLPLLDIYDAGWMTSGNFGWSNVCRDTNTGGRAAGLVPTVFAYVAASIVKGAHQLCDCNVSGCAGGDLCKYGSQYIDQDWARILAAYTSNGTAAGCMGTRPYIVRMEPDWYQYIGSGQTVRWTAAQAGTKMTALVQAMGTSRPNAYYSMDLSPWMSDSAATSWFANFDMSLFTFINTSGGNSDGNIPKIRANNSMTWAGAFKAAGNKPIIADTGYGAAGAGTGEDTDWNVASGINDRMREGVAALIQPYPGATWGDTVASIQPQLNTPPTCY